MTMPSGVFALRHSVSWSRMDHVQTYRLHGADAFDAMDALCPRDLFLHDGQLLQTLFLEDDGSPLADVTVGSDGDDFLLFAETRDGADLGEWVARNAPTGFDFEFEPAHRDRVHLALNGPYAWELLGALLGPEVIGLPYLSFIQSQYGLCMRVGKTGEFGYELLVPAAKADEFVARVEEVGQRFDVAEASRADLDLCGLENWFFNVRHEGTTFHATAIEFQQQWRLNRHKTFVGKEAIAAKLSAGPEFRVVAVGAAGPFASGDMVTLEGQQIGKIVRSDHSYLRDETVGLAAVDIAWAHPGLPGLSVGAQTARLLSPPMLNNRSLHVSPQRHSYATRTGDRFPPIHLANRG